MITINLDEIKKKVAEQAGRVKPKISITVVPGNHKSTAESKSDQIVSEEINKAQIRRTGDQRKNDLVRECWKNFNEIKTERAQLSNTIHDEIERGASRPQLRELYDKIESFRPQLEEAFRIARHAEQYGELPAPAAVAAPTQDIFSLKDKKRKLIDKRCKLQTKIRNGKDQNQIIQWQIDLDLATAEYNDTDEQLKRLEGKL